jgi:4a-hydroxytetrahydrobiopterin dehydratase
MESLAQQKCTACRKDSPLVTEEEIRELHPRVPEWQMSERKGAQCLERTFKFPDFAQALAFTNNVGAQAEEEGHHPEMLLEWGRVRVAWWTHKIKGLHRNDFIMAAKTDEVYSEMQG